MGHGKTHGKTTWKNGTCSTHASHTQRATQATAFKEHTTAFKEHTTTFKEHTTAFKERQSEIE